MYEYSGRIQYPEYYSDRDLQKILRHAWEEGPLAHAFFHFLIMTGVRLREVMNLSTDDLYFGDNVVRIRSAFAREYRTVPFLDRSVLRQYLDLRKDRPSEQNQRVFLHRGKPLSLRFIRKLCERIERYSGIRLTTHRIRQSIAIHLYRNGADVTTIAAIFDIRRRRYLSQSGPIPDETLVECMRKHHPLLETYQRKHSSEFITVGGNHGTKHS